MSNFARLPPAFFILHPSSFILLFLLPSALHAWGRDGHQIVAAIGESRLTDEALSAVHEILGEETSLAGISTWADVVRPDREETAPWHYVNIPLTLDEYDPSLCPNGDCVTEIISRHANELKNWRTMDALDREEKLKFLVHFIGDQSQPLHNANEEGDLGGNLKLITFYDRETNLHSLWDTQMIRREQEQMRMSNRTMMRELNDEIRPEQIRLWAKGTPVDWTNDSHRVAMEFVYPGWNEWLGDEYFYKSIGVVRVQLQKGGVRTAHVLNTIFDPHYNGTPEIRRPARLEGDAPFPEAGAFQQLIEAAP